MKAFQIESFKDLLLLVLFLLISFAISLGVPSLVTWVTWNGVVGDILEGPYIAFWQAIILTAALLLTLYQIIKPEIIFEVHHLDDTTPDEKLSEKQKRIKKLKDKKQDS